MHFNLRSPAGFTLVELIIILVLIGILAVAALPRFWDRDVFNSRGFYDETLSALRYAQKTAIAQRRNVCATFTTNNTVTLTIAANPGAPGVALCNTPLAGPQGITPFVVTGGTINYSSPPTNFQFDALGRPFRTSDFSSFGQTINVVGSPLNIVVTPETGYVHP